MTDPRQLTIDSGSFSPVDSYEDLFLASNESEPVMSIVGHYANPSDEAEDYGDELDWPEDQISPFQRPLFVSPRNAELFGASGASPKHLSTHFKLETDPVVKNLKELLTTLPSLESNEGEEGERDRVHEWALSRIVEAYEKQMETYARESDLKAQIQIMLELGNVYMKEGYFAEAFESYEKARIKAINGKQSSEQLAVIEAECLLSKGKSVMMLKQYTLTDSLLNEAEKILSLRELDEQSKFLLAEVKIQQGLMNVHMKKYSPAAEHLTVALTIVYDQTEKVIYHTTLYREACYQIAVCLRELDRKELALEYARQAADAAYEKHENKEEISGKISSLVNELAGELEATNNSNAIDDEDIEDWDLEFETGNAGATDTRLSSLKDRLFPKNSQKDNLMDEELFPSRFKLFKGNNPMNLIKFPKPSCLYSLQTKDGYRFMQDTKLESYISNTAAIPDSSIMKSSPSDKWKAFQDEISRVDNGVMLQNIYWAHLACQCCWLWVFRKEKSFYIEKLVELFIQRLQRQQFSVLEEKTQAQLFYLCLQVMRFCGKLKALNTGTLLDLKDSIMKHFPEQGDYITLVETEILYNNLSELSKKGQIEISMHSLLEIFDRHYKESSEALKNNIFGLVYYEAFPDDDVIAAHTLFIIQCLCSYISPLTLKSLDEMWSAQFSVEDSSWDGISSLVVSNQEKRLELLKSLYLRINCFSPLKASMAEVLGMHSRHVEGNSMIAEQYFFESIFILDNSKDLIHGIPTICRENGIQCLKEYGDVLMANTKYRFGIVAHEAALKVFQHVHGKESQAIVRRIAVMATENNDWRRSLQYYRKIHSKAQQDSNVNEIVYISEVLSNMFLERGDFRNAEVYLSKALQYVPTTTGKVDALALQLQLKLSNLYMHGYYFERGIELLAKLLDLGLPSLQKCGVMIHLAEAYLKKRWLKDCESMLNKMSPLLDQPLVSLKIGISTNNTESDAAKAIEIAAKCYYHQQKYTYALFWVDEALRRCHPSNLCALGRYFFLKGKVFQELCLKTKAIKFPTPLQPENIQRHPLYQQLQSTRKISSNAATKHIRRDLYNSEAELLYDCLRCYNKAYEYFRTISDEIRVAKVVNRIARTQIDYIFEPLALLGGKLEDIINVQIPDYSFNKQGSEGATSITLAGIEQPASVSLEISVKTGSIMMVFEGYLTMAEIRYLQGRKASSQKFWNECRKILFALFMEGPTVVVAKGAPPGFISKIHSLLKRLVRLLFCYDCDFINKHLIVIDALLQLDYDLDQVTKRPVEHQPEPLAEQESLSSSTNARDSSTEDTSTQSSISSIEQPKPPFHQHQRSLSANAVAMHFDIDYSEKKKLGNMESFSKSNKVYSDLSETSKKSFLRLKTKKPRSCIPTPRKRVGFSTMGKEDSTSMRERVAERAWSCLFRIKQHSQMYSNGGLSEEEVSRANQASIRKLFFLMNRLRGKDDLSKDLSLLANDSPKGGKENKGADSLQDTELSYDVSQLHQFMYILLIDDIVFYYIPAKKIKRYHQFGGTVCNESNHQNNNEELTIPEPKITVEDSNKHRKMNSTISLRDIYVEPTFDERKMYGEQANMEIHTRLDAWSTNYIRSLIVQGRRERLPTSIVEASTALAKIFPGPFDALLTDNSDDSGWYTPSHSRRRGSFLRMFTNQTDAYESLSEIKVSSTPVLLVCSRSLQIVPWEVMLRGDVARNINLYWQWKAEDIKDLRKKGLPCYFCCYSGDDSKHISPVEHKRKEWIFKKQMHRLGKTAQPAIVRESLSNIPFHTPLMRYGKKVSNYQKKYRYVNFLELGSVIGNPSQLVSSIDAHLDQGEFPVFLLTFVDLLDMSEAVLQLIAHRPDCTLLFVPEAGTRETAKLLMKLQESYLRHGELGQGMPLENGYKFLMGCVRRLQREEHIPIVVVNPPRSL